MQVLYGLIFDVDGVIADSERVNAEASIQVFADLFGVTGVQREDFEAGLGRGAEAYLQAAARANGLELTPAQLAAATQARQAYFFKILSAAPLPAFPGVLDLMRVAMTHPDFRVAIATSSAREKSRAVLESARIPYQQLVYITGDDVKSKKPDPELFLTAARGIGIPPRQCVVIEDAPDGVKAAHAAGCKCVAVTNSTSAEKLNTADKVVASLTQVTLETLADLLTVDHV